METQLPIVDVREIANREENRFLLRDRDFHVILDTCSIKRIPLTRQKTPLFAYQFEDKTLYYLVLTKGVCQEVTDLTESIPWYLNQFVQAITSEVIDQRIPEKNRNLIQMANLMSSLGAGKELNPMGENDIQIVNYAFERARQDLQTLIVSFDTHIARSVRSLRGRKRWIRKNMFRIGLRDVIKELYPHINPNNFPHIVN